MRGGGGGLIYHHAPFHEAQSLSQNVNTAKARASFTFRPTPSRRLFLISKSHIVPRPRAEGGSGRGDKFAVACSHMACRHRIAPSRLIRYRSFDCSKSTCGLSVPFRQAHRLSDTRGEAAPASSSHPAAFSASPGFAVLRLSPRPFDTAGGAMRSSAYLSADGIDGGRRRRFMRRGCLLFRYGSALVRLRRSVLLFVCPIRETGRGLFISPRFVICR